MKDELYSKVEVLRRAKKICKEINEQIPLASNRYRPDIEDEENFDEELNKAEVEYHINKHLSSLFSRYLIQNNLSNKKWSSDDNNNFIQIAMDSVGEIYNEIKIINKALGKSFEVSLDALKEELKFSLDQKIISLISNEQLTISNNQLEKKYQFSKRMKKNQELIKHREIIKNQLQSMGSEFFEITKCQDELMEKNKLKENLVKFQTFATGSHYANTQCNSGFCGEHNALALWKFYEKPQSYYDYPLINHVKSIEAITLPYVNKEGKEENNHSFIIINRDPNSDLQDARTWGVDAVFFDAWNQWVCDANEFYNTPDEYYDYPVLGKWTSVTYTQKDADFMKGLTKNQKDFAITDNFDLEKRRTLILDEYQLTPITSKNYAYTNSFLTEIIKNARPQNFENSIELFITTCSNQLIIPIVGLKEIGIAIHKDFFQLIEDNEASVADLQVGLASILYEILHHGLKGAFSVDYYIKSDRDLIKNSQCPEDLIRFLRLSYDFVKLHETQDHHVHELSSSINASFLQNIITQRIKNINTLMAKEEYPSIPLKKESIPDEVYKELSSLHFKTYYAEGVNKEKSIVDQLNYLTTCLPDLKKELFAHELYYKMYNRRIREFVSLLASINVNLNDKQQHCAANNLIQKAYDLKVPGFDLIYATLTKAKREYGALSGTIPALGPFLLFKQLIKKIATCENYEELSSLSRKFVDLWNERYIYLFVLAPDNSAKKYVDDFYKTHRYYPKGNSRYFGSKIGTHIEINESLKKSNLLLDYMTKKQDQNIAKMLYIMGNHSEDVLNTIPVNDLSKLLQQHIEQNTRLGSFGFHDNDIAFYETFENISGRKQLITDMFDDRNEEEVKIPVPFKKALVQFVEKNEDLLTTLHLFRNRRINNFNGEATHYLLKKFAEIAQYGSEEDKIAVKDFFLKKNPGSLHSLQSRFGQYTNRLFYNSLFVKFVIENSYQEIQVNLFSHKEKMDFYFNSEVFKGTYGLPPEQYINLFELKHKTLSLDCLRELFTLLKQQGITSDHPVCDLVLKHLEEVEPYTLMSPDTKSLVSLIRNIQTSNDPSLYNPFEKFIKTIVWNLPDPDYELSFDQLNNLAYLYRAFNEHANFPSLKVQLDYQKLLIEGLQQASIEQQLQILQSILFNPDFSTPVPDYQFATTLIDLWILAVEKNYGKDDGSTSYCEQLTPLLKNINRHAPSRDKIRIFTQLLECIQAQGPISEFVDTTITPIKLKTFSESIQDNADNNKISGLSAISLCFSKKQKDKEEFIDFFSSPLSETTLKQFITFIMNHPYQRSIIAAMGITLEENTPKKEIEENIRFYSVRLYQQFWDASLEERAVIFDHLLIPAQETSSEEKEIKAYEEALEFVGKRLFPDAENEDSDDNFAMALLQSYLHVSNKYQRGILLAGMLVASNTQDDKLTYSTGKKIALLCEHMGPAYVKLAQAIHSYPGTPPSLREDIAHVKGHANPPKRWELWRLIERYVSKKDRENIKYVGRLLGSASYNLALDVTLNDGSTAVLILLREHAALDANKGFTQLKNTIENCQHKKMNTLREPLSSILSEAKKQSLIEMDPIASQKQFDLAKKLYVKKRFNLSNEYYEFDIQPSQFLFGNDGYRVITKLEGTEFNDLPTQTKEEKNVKKEVAKAIMTIELTNILSGMPFDSDRHGNQLRVNVKNKKVQLGLFDFGEMALEKPSEKEIALFCKALSDLPYALINLGSFSEAFNSVLSKHINSEEIEENKHYLMRVRKAILALHDVQMELTAEDLNEILKGIITNSSEINSTIKHALDSLVNDYLWLSAEQFVNNTSTKIKGYCYGLYNTFFGSNKSDKKQENNPSQCKKREFDDYHTI